MGEPSAGVPARPGFWGGLVSSVSSEIRGLTSLPAPASSVRPTGIPSVGVVRGALGWRTPGRTPDRGLGRSAQRALRSRAIEVRFTNDAAPPARPQGLPPPENAFWRRPDVGQKVMLVVGALEAERTQFGAPRRPRRPAAQPQESGARTNIFSSSES